MTDIAERVDATVLGHREPPRWSPGERLHDVLEQAVAARCADDEVAAETAARSYRFRDLRVWSDRVARDLAPVVAAGDRVALLFDRTPLAWVAMLALSKLGAAWVPLDTAFPTDRIAFIARDAGARIALTTPGLAPRLEGTGLEPRIVAPYRGRRDDAPFPPRAAASDDAYVIYTSGTTGTPKGVPIAWDALCSFIRVAADCYGFTPADRVYQGLTIAFDFSVEEIWVPLVAGARLIPAPDGVALVGDELARFLADRRVTALCCPPTLLASIDADLPLLRLLLVSGEGCPRELVRRWATPTRRMVNLYGPTETTVSATWAVLDPDDTVTIGVPLPTYRACVLEPGGRSPVAAGEPGELVVAGVGVARGYLGRPELTARAFIPDPFGLPGERAYRTGDLVRVDPLGRIVSLGRIDTQVKVRGYRIELDEIESVLLSLPGIAQAAVAVVRADGRPAALAGYYSERPQGAPAAALLLAELRRRLPAFMVPATLDRLDSVPLLPSQKVDRAALPAPSRPPTGAIHIVADPREAAVARAVAAVLELDDVDPAADLFADLGADSFSIARLCAALRQGVIPSVTTRMVYDHPSVRALAAASRDATAAPPASAAAARRDAHRARLPAHVLTGIAQAAVLFVAVLAGAFGIDAADRLLAGTTGLGAYLAAVAVTAGATVVVAGTPIALKWLLVGRWRAGEIDAWSPGYLRFWIVRTAIRLSPMRLLAGSPLYVLFLRALGARIGRHALVLSDHVPVCADLVRIGADAVVGPGVRLDGYRVRDGRVEIGPVRIGDGATVGYGSHLDIGTAIGEGGRLAHASALLEGQVVPSGRAWHGSPALDAGAAPAADAAPRVGTAARARYAALQLATWLLVSGPLLIGVAVAAVDVDVFDPVRAAGFALLLLTGGWVTSALVPRLLASRLRPDRAYPLYSARWAGVRAAVRLANSPFMNELFGDSSAVVWYLRSVGVRFRSVLQTGSNLGTAQHFDLPGWCSIGGGTLISDGLAMPNTECSPHSFRVRPIQVGERVFMGNGVVYPPGAGLGDDVLLATKVMVPVDSTIRSGVGLLGSPAFEVPRSVRRDEGVRAERGDHELRRDLARKNRHNAGTGALFLLQRFTAAYLAVAIVGLAVPGAPLGLAVALVGAAAAELALLVVTDLLCRGGRRLVPRTCSLYDRRFWRHERYWKLADAGVLAVLDGTPFKPLVWRLLGVRVGRMLLDDGAAMPERSLVRIGDHVTLGAGATLHGHSLEDGVFKSGAIEVGDGSSVGPSALVHYGVQIGAGCRIAPDAFLMKGERVLDGETWVGNPARPAGA